MEQTFKSIQEFLKEFNLKTGYSPLFIIHEDKFCFNFGKLFYAETAVESANSLIDEFFNSGIIVQEIRDHLREFASRRLDF